MHALVNQARYQNKMNMAALTPVPTSSYVDWIAPAQKKYRIGLVGTGFIASGFARLLQGSNVADLHLASVLTRRARDEKNTFPFAEQLTHSVSELIDSSDIIIECSGDVLHATDVIHQAMLAGKPVVTMNSEFHVTTGSYFASRGLITEAEGDQPGCLAALKEEAEIMGFKPVVYGNMKGFLNHNPVAEEMAHWSSKQGISIEQTTSFTDGTKIQIEQAFVANAFGATITKQGMEGPSVANDVNETAIELAKIAESMGAPIADYVLAPGKVAGVFVVATHKPENASAFRYLKMGEGPFYVLMKNYHLCQYEILKTVRRITQGGGVLMNNSAKPSVSVVGIAKHDMPVGTRIHRAMGGFQVRGEAARVSDVRGHVPIGLIQNAVVSRPIQAGQIIGFDDLDLPETMAFDIARSIFA
jgi:predicted homoserine dehydrogenase-like protein